MTHGMRPKLDAGLLKSTHLVPGQAFARLEKFSVFADEGRRKIHRGSKPALLQGRKRGSVEIAKAIVKGDRHKIVRTFGRIGRGNGVSMGWSDSDGLWPKLFFFDLLCGFLQIVLQFFQ